MRLALLLALLLLLTIPAARAQDGVQVVQGGEPGIVVLFNGQDLTSAAQSDAAFRVDPAREANLSMRLTPPPGVTWEIRTIRVGLVVDGPGSRAPDKLSKQTTTETSIPPGFTVYVNRTFDLGALKPLGAGLFLMEVRVEDASGAELYAQPFYVHVVGNPLLTVAGAAAAVASVATGYGVWQILRDIKEIKKARDRHRAKVAEASRLARVAAGAIDFSAGLEGALSVAQDNDAHAERLERRRPIAWTATGLGLGAVTLSWLQFFGYVPLNLGRLAITALGTAALFLTGALIAAALAKRLREKLRTRTLVPEDVSARGADVEPPREGVQR